MENNYNQKLDQYNHHRELYKTFCAGKETSRNKLLLASCAIENQGRLPEKQQKNFQHDYLEPVARNEGNSDMKIITLIRMLYFLSESNNPTQEAKAIIQQILTVLRRFPFWPMKPENCCVPSRKLVFWSENHLFMTLSSAYLFFQFQEKQRQKKQHAGNKERNEALLHGSNFETEHIECQLLQKYLEVHTHELFKGTYEINSHGYLHYTFSAMLNLYDFADNLQIKANARVILDYLTIQSMLGTDPLHGIATFSGNEYIIGSSGLICNKMLIVGAREYDRNRLRPYFQPIAPLVVLMNNGKCVDHYPVTALTDFLLTTTWHPSPAGFEALHCDGPSPIHLQPGNHSLEIIDGIYGREKTSRGCCCLVLVDNLVPIYWSAGLLIHPQYLHQNTCYICQHGLCCNQQLCYIPYLSWASCCCHTVCCCWPGGALQVDHLLSGQVYLGIKPYFYKRPQQGLILSSFESFNPHFTGYQQVPWFGNLSGVPMWSQSGSGTESICCLDVKVFNTHNPVVKQHEDVLLVTYLAPPALASFPLKYIFQSKSRFYWPLPFFSQHTLHPHSSNEVQAMTITDTSQRLRLDESDTTLLSSASQRYWCVAAREHVYAAVLCTQPVRIDYSTAEDAAYIPQDGAREVYLPRLICEETCHSWIVVVGTKVDYPTIQDFVRDKLRNITVIERCQGNYYQVEVSNMESTFALRHSSTI